MMRIWRRKYDRIQVGRKQYRLEFNWNAYAKFMEFYDMKFGDLKNLDKINPSQFVTFIYEAIIEGCRLENKKFPYSREDFAAMITSESIDKLNIILQSQLNH